MSVCWKREKAEGIPIVPCSASRMIERFLFARYSFHCRGHFPFDFFRILVRLIPAARENFPKIPTDPDWADHLGLCQPVCLCHDGGQRLARRDWTLCQRTYLIRVFYSTARFTDSVCVCLRIAPRYAGRDLACIGENVRTAGD